MEQRSRQRFGWGYLRERHHLKDPGVDGMTILKCILQNWGAGTLNSYGSALGQVTGCCECGNETPGSIKCEEFLGWFAVTRPNERSVGNLTNGKAL